MAKRKNTFTRIGGSTYKCEVCGRQTRHTGVQALGSGLCPECWELCGYDNQVNDSGEPLTAGERKAVEAMLAHIGEKGGDVAKVKALNGYLWPEVEEPKAQAVEAPKASKKMTREQWLTMALHKHVGPLLAKHGATLPADCKVSVGFPGGGSARKRIGECWPRSRSSLKVNEIFLNPSMKDVKRLMDVLVHEAIHAADDCKSGHKGFFTRTAKAVGLQGKMTATHAGPELAKWIDATLAKMPAFDYGSLDLDGRKKQTTRMVKVICTDCGYTLRTTQKWLEVGLPTCCCGGAMGSC